MADKAEQAKDELGKSGNEYIEKLIEKKDELGKSGNGYIEKLKAEKLNLKRAVQVTSIILINIGNIYLILFQH